MAVVEESRGVSDEVLVALSRGRQWTAKEQHEHHKNNVEALLHLNGVNPNRLVTNGHQGHRVSTYWYLGCSLSTFNLLDFNGTGPELFLEKVHWLIVSLLQPQGETVVVFQRGVTLPNLNLIFHL